jgi:hypothetical protein
MAQDEIHIQDIGTVLTTTLKDGTSTVDISGATTKQIILGKPDGTSSIKTGSFTTDGTDGSMYYTTISGDLNQIGWWKIQGYIVSSAGSEWRSDIGNFEVHRNI